MENPGHAQKSHNRAQVLIESGEGGHFPNHTLPVLIVIVRVSTKVSQQNDGVSGRGALKHRLQGLQKGWALLCA